MCHLHSFSIGTHAKGTVFNQHYFLSQTQHLVRNWKIDEYNLLYIL